MDFVPTSQSSASSSGQTELTRWRALLPPLLCDTSRDPYKAWHDDASPVLRFYLLVLKWDKEGIGVSSHFNAFYNASRCCMLVSLRAARYQKNYMLCGLKDTLQCDNKRHINLTKMVKRSCKDAMEHARTLKRIFPKDLRKTILKQSTCPFSTVSFTSDNPLETTPRNTQDLTHSKHNKSTNWCSEAVLKRYVVQMLLKTHPQPLRAACSSAAPPHGELRLLISNLNLPSFSIKPSALVLSRQALVKGAAFWRSQDNLHSFFLSKTTELTPAEFHCG